MNKATEPETLVSGFAGPERRTGAARLQVGACRVEPDLDRISGPAGETLLEPKAMAVLVYLARRPGKVVSADELIDAIWLGRPMGDNPVYRCIAQLRRALGDDPKAPSYIATVPTKGYRLIAPVLAVAPEAPPDPMPGEGEPGRPEVAVPAPTPLWRSGKVTRLILLAGLTGLAGLLWGRHLVTGDGAPLPASPPAQARAMLAVLPFENLGGDPGQEYFSDGLTEELLTELGRLDPERLGVIARTSVMSYKRTAKSVRQIGRELGVDFLLEGSVRRAGEQVRISAQLIRVDDQTHLWAESYERSLQEIFALQSDVARSVAGAIELRLAERPRAPAVARTIDPAAYDLYLKARYYWRRSGTAPENLPNAFEYFQRTVAADPGFGPAWSHFALVNLAMLHYRLQPRIEGLDRAREAARRAIELDRDKGPALTVLAEVKQALEWDWQGAETAYRRALEIGPDDAGAHLSYGLFLERMGRLEEARKPLQRALELEPAALTFNTHVVGPDFYAGDYTRAIAQYEKVLGLDPEYAPARLFLGRAYEQQGRFQEAIESFQRATTTATFDGQAALAAQGHAHARAGEPEQARRVLRELTQNQGDVDPYRVALIHVGLGDLDEAFGWLDAAAEARSADLLNIRIDPRLRPLRGDPRYRDLLVRMNLSPPGA